MQVECGELREKLQEAQKQQHSQEDMIRWLNNQVSYSHHCSYHLRQLRKTCAHIFRLKCSFRQYRAQRCRGLMGSRAISLVELQAQCSPLLLQVNELQLHGTTKHRLAALHTDGAGYSSLDWESRGASRCA